MEFLKKEMNELFRSIGIFLLFNFLLFNFSWFISSNILRIKEFIEKTNYQNLTLILDIINIVIGNVIFYISIVFFVGSLLLILIIFIIKILSNKKTYF